MEFKKVVQISEQAFVENQIVTPDHTLWRKIFGTIVILIGVGFYLGQEIGVTNTVLTVASVSAVYVFLITVVNKYTSKLIAKKNFKKNNLGSIKINFLLNHEGITLSLNEKVALYKWQQIKDVVNTPLGLYFYTPSNVAIILDKKNLEDEEIKEIESLIVKYKDDKTKLKLITTKKV